MRRKTHERIIKELYPDINPKLVELINSIIDTPKSWMPPYSPVLGQVPGLSHRGHRKYGHDLLTAVFIALVTGGPKGIPVAVTHLLTDAARDQLVEAGGPDAADIAEAVFNYIVAQKEKRRKGRKRRSHSSRKNRLGDSG